MKKRSQTLYGLTYLSGLLVLACFFLLMLSSDYCVLSAPSVERMNTEMVFAVPMALWEKSGGVESFVRMAPWIAGFVIVLFLLLFLLVKKQKSNR